MLEIAVIICAHNPREHFLDAVLSALQTQTLPFTRWELVLVDNVSTEPLAGRVDLDWHPRGRIVREEGLGLTHARLRGLAETSGQILVYVDDDNELHADYLAAALEVARERPTVGAWGGDVRLKFDMPPPSWTQPYWELLAMKEVKTELTTRKPNSWAATPVGAGLCVRRKVMLQYRDQLDLTLWRRCMDRSGGSLMSAGDQDIANTACDMGMEMGVFPSLRLDHLIPPERMIEAYLLRLATAAEFSNHMLRWCRDPEFPAPTLSPRRFIRYLRNCVSRRGQDRRFYLARVRGERAAAKFHRSLARDAGQEAEDFIRNQRFMGENVGGLNSKHERKKSFT